MPGSGPWMGPMWGFWWILPLIGLLLCLFFIIAMARMMSGGGHFMGVGRQQSETNEVAQLRKQVEDLRSQVEKLATTR
jgi:uncharacterized membrane protein